MNEMKCKRCGANENRIHGFCSMECETAWEYEDDIRDLTARIAELEAAQRWIPVSERLPELDQDVFAVVDGELDRGHFYQQWDGEVFFSSDEKGAMMVATHWMPLPELPEVQE